MNAPSPAHAIDRRTVLKAAGAAIALPPLASLHWRAGVAETLPAATRRLVFVGIGFGVTNETWFPDRAKTGRDFELSAGLAPLARHKHRMSVIQGLSNKSVHDAHWGSTFYLTTANRYAVPGRSFTNSISVDQVASEAIGQDNRFTSLQLIGGKTDTNGHGPGLSLAWNRQGKPLAGLDSPLAVYARLFGADDLPPEALRERITRQRSVLDLVLDEAKSIDRRLGSRDREKLAEYFESVRDIETRLDKDEQWLGAAKPRPPLAEPPATVGGTREIELMYDLTVAALRTDSTRVVTYRQPIDGLMEAIGAKVASHDMSHYVPGERMETSQRRDLKNSELLAGFLDKLAAVTDADGSSLLDNTIVSFGSNIRTIHYLDNVPAVVAGGGGALAQGQHIVLPAKQTPLANLWLTLLRATGVSVEEFGDSTGTISELEA